MRQNDTIIHNAMLNWASLELDRENQATEEYWVDTPWLFCDSGLSNKV